MNRLDKLINELCPDGVDYVKIGDICHILRGKRLTKKELVSNGEFPVVHGGTTPMGYYNKYNRKSCTTVVVNTGNAGYVFWQDKKFWSSDACFSLYPEENLLDKFLYYFLSSREDILKSKIRSGAMPTIDSNAIADIFIPVPPLEVQREIVRILDKYSETVTALQHELEKELDLRKNQYSYYRDKLLTFGDNVEYKTLEEVIVSLNTGLNPRKFFKLNTNDATNYYITIREIKNGKIFPTEKTDRINDEALKLCNNRSNLEIDDILFSGTGTIGETVVITENPTNWNIKEGVYVIKPIKNKILPFFLHYLLQTEKIKIAYMKKVAGGTVKSIPMAEMKKLIIPVPPIEEQERIVKILDKFDTLCNDLTNGIPAEINARQKQYEYYRNKLLQFQSR